MEVYRGSAVAINMHREVLETGLDRGRGQAELQLQPKAPVDPLWSPRAGMIPPIRQGRETFILLHMPAMGGASHGRGQPWEGPAMGGALTLREEALLGSGLCLSRIPEAGEMRAPVTEEVWVRHQGIRYTSVLHLPYPTFPHLKIQV